MSKAIFFGLPLHGHVNPSLPLVRELADRGEEIVYYSGDAFAEKIKAAGARPKTYRNAFLRDMESIPDRMEEFSFLLLSAVQDVLQRELDEIRSENPDYIIHDSVAPWGKCIAQLLDVPAITSVPIFAFNRHVLAFGLRRGLRPKSLSLLLNKVRHICKSVRLRGQICRTHHLRGLRMTDLFWGRSGLNFVYTSKHFQPRVETFDDTFHFIGPSMAPRTETTPFPWEKLRHSTVIYVSLGTLFNAGEPFYRD